MDPKTVLEPHIEPKNSPLGPKKVKKYPEIKSKSNVRIEGYIENESCSTKLVKPKTVVESYSDLQTSPLGPKKDKNDPKIKSNLNVRIQGIIKNESFSTT